MRLRLAVAVLAVLAVSCMRHIPVARTPGAPPPTVWDRQIRNAQDAGDGDYPLRTLRDRVAAEPENTAIRLELAKAYRERGYPDVALEICRLAAARFPDSGEVRLALAGVLRDMKRQGEAISGLEAFTRAHPRAGAEYYSWLGILRDDTGHWAEAEAAHRKALELDPKAGYLHNNLGYNLLMQKKNAEAAAEFREALKINPQSLLARNNLGLALAQSDSGAEAVAAWQAGSDPATAHNNLAAVWIEKGNYEAARKELEIALGYNKDFPAALKNLELVSRLDGSPILFHVKQDETRLARFKTGFKKLWVGPLDDSRKPEVLKNTASGSATGEER